MRDPLVARALEVGGAEPLTAVGVVELAGADAGRPAWSGVGEDPRELVAVDTVVPLVGGRVGGEVDARTRHCLLDDRGQVADLVVFRSRAERLAVDDLARRLEHRDEGARDVLNVDTP
jgi:hypothetical protein